MDGTGEAAAADTATRTVPELEAELAAARQAEATEDDAEAAAAAPAEGDGKPAAEGAPPATLEGTGAVSTPANPTGPGAAVPADAGAAGDQPSVLELLTAEQQAAKDAGNEVTSPHGFIEDLRSVADQLVADGRIVEADLVTATEAPRVQATLIKLVGELLAKVR